MERAEVYESVAEMESFRAPEFGLVAWEVFEVFLAGETEELLVG